jgi:16S rRNA (uracil1498-N3)-methyltransferase
MRRYWIEKDKLEGNNFSIDGDLFHHLTDVCRLTVGDKFELLCGNQKAYLVEMKERTKRMAIAEIIEEREIKALKEPYIRLAISIPKFQKLDTIVEKCVELGVKSVHPFVSEFSFVRKLEPNVMERVSRWERITKAATQQSGRGDLMEIAKPVKFEDIIDSINRNPNACGLFSYEGEASHDLKTAISAIKNKEPRELWVIVGSEGGFSKNEVDLLQKKGLDSVTMGDQVLRVETACLALVSVIKYELG